MDLNRLRYFSVVAQTGSIRRAADLLHLSPTALSKAVKVLEREIGTRLVRPQGRGIVLTEAGTLLARRVEPMLAQLAALPGELTTRRPAAPVLRYASHEVFGTYFTEPLLDEMPADGAIEHRYLPPGEIEQAVLVGDSDLGVTYIPVPRAGLDHRRAGAVEMGTFGLARLARSSFDELQFAAPVQPSFGATVRAQSLDGWPDDRVPRTVRHRITTTEAALELCRQGRAVARFPSFVVRLHNAETIASRRLVRVPDPDGIDAQLQDVYVVTRSGDPMTEQAGWIATALERVTATRP